MTSITRRLIMPSLLLLATTYTASLWPQSTAPTASRDPEAIAEE